MQDKQKVTKSDCSNRGLKEKLFVSQKGLSGKELKRRAKEFLPKACGLKGNWARRK